MRLIIGISLLLCFAFEDLQKLIAIDLIQLLLLLFLFPKHLFQVLGLLHFTVKSLAIEDIDHTALLFDGHLL